MQRTLEGDKRKILYCLGLSSRSGRHLVLQTDWLQEREVEEEPRRDELGRDVPARLKKVDEIGAQILRIGFHFRSFVVDQASEALGGLQPVRVSGSYHLHQNDSSLHDVVEPIPQSQAEINRQADAAIRDLFPRIPHTDRNDIIQRSFNKVLINVQRCHIVLLTYLRLTVLPGNRW